MTTKKEIQHTWKIAKLGEVCKLRNGYAFKSNEYQINGIPIIRISDINDNEVKYEKSIRTEEKLEYNNYLVERNAILIAMSGATTGKFGIYKNDEKVYQNQRVGCFKILNNEILNFKFLFYLLNNLKRKIVEDAYGGAQPNISAKMIEELEIPLPPLNEQHRIVTKLEELFSQLDIAVSELKKAKQQIKTYKQSVLSSAFTGKLTIDNSQLTI